MRTARRTFASIIVALTLSVVLALPASAAQIITYEGNTSAATPNRVGVGVLKRDDGLRFLHRLRVQYTLTCEDASTYTSGVSITGHEAPGSVKLAISPGTPSTRVTRRLRLGTSRWKVRSASETRAGMSPMPRRY